MPISTFELIIMFNELVMRQTQTNVHRTKQKRQFHFCTFNKLVICRDQTSCQNSTRNDGLITYQILA